MKEILLSSAWSKGFELTLRQLDSVFERFSVYEISPEVGDKLDPDAHQAMSLIETAEVPANHIFRWYRRVIA